MIETDPTTNHTNDYYSPCNPANNTTGDGFTLDLYVEEYAPLDLDQHLLRSEIGGHQSEEEVGRVHGPFSAGASDPQDGVERDRDADARTGYLGLPQAVLRPEAAPGGTTTAARGAPRAARRPATSARRWRRGSAAGRSRPRWSAALPTTGLASNRLWAVCEPSPTSRIRRSSCPAWWKPARQSASRVEPIESRAVAETEDVATVDYEAAVEKVYEKTFSPRELVILRESTSNAEFHYLGSAKIMAQIGMGFAEALFALMER